MNQWRGRSRGRGRNKGRGMYRASMQGQLSENTHEHVGLVQAAGRTVSSLQHLDTKRINLHIKVWLTKPKAGDKPTIVAVKCFEKRHGLVGVQGRIVPSFEVIFVPGDTPLDSYSY